MMLTLLVSHFWNFDVMILIWWFVFDPLLNSTRWNSCLAPELNGLSSLDENMSHGASAGFWLDDIAAYTFVGETTILPRTVDTLADSCLGAPAISCWKQ